MKKVAKKFAKSKMFIVSLHRQSRKTKMLANRGARVAQHRRNRGAQGRMISDVKKEKGRKKSDEN